MDSNFTQQELGSVLQGFGCEEPPTRAVPWGDGHIHRTLRLSFSATGARQGRPLLLQALNSSVFPDLEALMQNLTRVALHARAKLQARGVSDLERRVLSVHRAQAGGWLVRHAGEVWRCMDFIEGTRALSSLEDASGAFQVARTFGGFIELLSDFDASELRATLPDFHHTPKRFRDLQLAVERDAAGRVHEVSELLDFLEERQAGLSFVEQALASGELPTRVTHNDTKVNNALLDERSGEGLCAIDLDTVMPGSALYDLGDLLRSGLSASAEDEPDAGRIHARPEIFRGLVAGFLSGLGRALAPQEREWLFDCGPLITLEIGMRFLTDYLEGDVYYAVARPGHNLERARAQLALVRSMEAQGDVLRSIAREECARLG